MDDFQTVYFFGDYAEWLIRFQVVVFVVSIGVVSLGLYFAGKSFSTSKGKSVNFMASIGMSVGLILVLLQLIISLNHDGLQPNELLSVYQNGLYQTVEGEVDVLSEQPKTGHAPGDRIRVGGVDFTINYFDLSVGYNRTIAYSGVLKERAYVRIYYFQGKILRIDMRRPQ